MTEELRQLLSNYLAGEVHRRDLRQYFAEFDWDDKSDEAVKLRDTIGRLDLILQEVGEGLRDESELQAAALDFAASRIFGVLSARTIPPSFETQQIVSSPVASRLILAGR